MDPYKQQQQQQAFSQPAYVQQQGYGAPQQQNYQQAYAYQQQGFNQGYNQGYMPQQNMYYAPQAQPQVQQQPSQPDEVGKRLNILTKAGLRYQGTLVNINQVTDVLDVENVTCYGTENRKPMEEFEAASTEITPTLSFQADQIATLEFLPDPTQWSTPAPAPIQQTPAPVQNLTPVIASATPITQSPVLAQPLQPEQKQKPVQKKKQKPVAARVAKGPPTAAVAAVPSTTQTMSSVAVTDAPEEADNATEEFDFEAANARFNKAEFVKTQTDDASLVNQSDMNAIAMGMENLPVITVKYDAKKSFFDDISRSSRQARTGRNTSRDSEAFGDDAQTQRAQHSHGRRNNHRDNNYNSNNGGGRYNNNNNNGRYNNNNSNGRYNNNDRNGRYNNNNNNNNYDNDNNNNNNNNNRSGGNSNNRYNNNYSDSSWGNSNRANGNRSSSRRGNNNRNNNNNNNNNSNQASDDNSHLWN